MIKYYVLTILGFICSVFVYDTYASSVPVGVLVKVVNCPVGAVLVVDDVETGMRVDDRGKLKVMVPGIASYPIQAQIHDMTTGKDYESITTTAAMGVTINLDCDGMSFPSRQ